MKFYAPGVLTYDTIAPASVNSCSSHVCIRVTSGNIEKFFEKVEINTAGELIYKPVKAAVSDQGRIFLEVDIGRMRQDQKPEKQSLAGYRSAGSF